MIVSPERLLPPIRRLGYTDLAAATHRLRAEPLESTAWQALIRELSIGETYFFRDAEKLETAITATITARAEQNRRSIIAWSAGCATGEEAYTLAALVSEHIPDPEWRVHIVGTDINSGALRTAGRGIYGQWSLRLPRSAERAGLTPDSSRRWHVSETLRRLVEFRWLNMTDGATQYPDADLVVCRNVLMYLDPAVRTRVRARLAAAVLPGGALVMDDIDIAFSPNTPTFSPPAMLATYAPERDSSVPVRHPTQAQDTSALYEQARAAADVGQFEIALRLLDDAPPLDLACTWLRALIYIQQDRAADAIRTVQRCLYLEPSFALGFLTLGNLYAACNDALSARRQWLNAARLTARSAPDDPLPFGEGLTAGDVQTAIGVRAL